MVDCVAIGNRVNAIVAVVTTENDAFPWKRTSSRVPTQSRNYLSNEKMVSRAGYHGGDTISVNKAILHSTY